MNGIIRFSPFARDWPYYCFTDPKLFFEGAKKKRSDGTLPFGIANHLLVFKRAAVTEVSITDI